MNRFLTGKSCVPLWNGPKHTSTLYPPHLLGAQAATTITVCKDPTAAKAVRCLPAPWSIKVFLCCAVLTRSTGCLHSRPPKSARSRFAQPENSTSSASPEARVSIVSNHNGRQIFIFGHSEYEAGTLAEEYFRDLDRVCPSSCPATTSQDDPAQKPIRIWRSHAYLFSTGSTITSASPPHTTWKAAAGPLL